MPLFRLRFLDDGSTVELEADDFDDDGHWVSLYRYLPTGADPMATTTRKDVLATFARGSLAGPPQPVSAW